MHRHLPFALTCTRECGFVCMEALTQLSRTQLIRNITSDYISRLPHRSVPGPLSLSPFSSSAFLRILYHLESGGLDTRLVKYTDVLLMYTTCMSTVNYYSTSFGQSDTPVCGSLTHNYTHTSMCTHIILHVLCIRRAHVLMSCIRRLMLYM